MDAAAQTELFAQHAQILQQETQLWTALTLISFAIVIFMAVMFGLAAWSVRSVNTRQQLLEKQQTDMEGKFTLLIDVLLQFVNERRQEMND